ncbi:hypothetical protein ACVC7V_10185 [Hydrogenophaga sp. A37]|nr:hypothetical protein [Hydrogenophaga sp. A37]
MSIARRIAELHGGEVRVVSVPDEVSCFRLVLPDPSLTTPQETLS